MSDHEHAGGAPAPVAEAGPAAAPVVTRRLIVNGSLWVVAGAALNKVVTALGQIALAWFLVPEAFGLAALALAIATVGQVVTAHGLREVLVARPDLYRSHASQALACAVSVNFGAGLLLCAAGWPMAMAFAQPALPGLLAVVAVSWAVAGFGVAPAAELERALRFRTKVLIHAGAGIVFTGLAVVLAWAGLGAFSLVWPLVAREVVMSALYWITARSPHRPQAPRPRSWRPLLLPTALVMVASVCSGVQIQAAVVVASLRAGIAEIGHLQWGFQIAMQSAFLFGISLQGVLFPSFASLRDHPRRQNLLALRAAALMATGLMLMGLIQFLLAEPVIEWLFAPRWWPAIAVVQAFSLLLFGIPLNTLAQALFKARGRFGLNLVSGALVSLATALAAWLAAPAGAEAMAWSTGAVMAGGGGVALAWAIASRPRTGRDPASGDEAGEGIAVP